MDVNFSETRDYLFSLKNRGSKFGIDRMRAFVEALGHPERSYPVIHVAGTNGKGSVCAMLEALYRDNGYKTGLFSSPHLVHLGERAQVNRRILGEAGIVKFVEQLRPVAAELGMSDPDLHPTFFEFVAAMAFLRFASEAVDIALIETGLGGRLDATNVVEPELSIITSISFDHMDLLGDTLEKIAAEKAGIIKPGRPVLIGCLPGDAERVMRKVAEERGCPLYSVRERFKQDRLPETNLTGGFQRWNAAVAVYATEIIAEAFPVQSTAALMQIDWPGRWQKLQLDGRTVILDATHNPEGSEALKENLQELMDEAGKPIIIAGTLGEDRGRSLMEAVAPYARELYLVEPNQDRATPTSFLEGCLPEKREFAVQHAELSRLISATDSCTLGQPGDIIVVTGSIYLIGEVLERIHGSPYGVNLQDKF
ncbi:MAG: bifunctional folylpolyglutamate synthase/dihydrofolate synthase [Opitutales bacterium]